MTRAIARLLSLVVVAQVLTCSPRASEASIFDDIGEGVATVTGLRGIVRGIARGAGEGIRDQLNKFVDEKIDPLISRVNDVIDKQIEHAAQRALETIAAVEKTLTDLIKLATENVEDLTTQFFAKLDASMDRIFGRLETLLDDTLCRVMPDGSIEFNLGPFGGRSQVKVKRPKRTHCYRRFLSAQEDPSSAVFRRWEYFSGELCEYELKLNRIDPEDDDSIAKMISGYDKLAEMANTARCAAPTPSAKAEMVQKLYMFQHRAGFLRRLASGWSK